MNRISDDILCKVEKPSRYTGGEINSCIKDIESVQIRYAFCFPDVYEVGMSHLGMKILYYVLNEREDTYCERVFAPWPDMEKFMREKNVPLYALESKDSLEKFDFLGFTLQYEMSYTNILNMLDMTGIAVRASERTEEDPLVMFGGPCAYNPEPLYNIADLFVMGEGEEVINEILDLYKDVKEKGKEYFLKEVSSMPGVYVPSLYEVEYKEDGTIEKFYPKQAGVPEKVKKRIIKDLNNSVYPDKIIVPYNEIVHDRVVMETFRGCTRGCRFCQAGMVYRPVREKHADKIIQDADKLIKSTGYEEISLSSLSICDYSDIQKLVFTILEKYEKEKVGVSLPSLRIDSFSVELIKQIQKVRKTGLTFAPEAGTQRMRDIINKGVTEQNLMDSVSSAFISGWSTIKLYFMIGLPYETAEDIMGIADLAQKVVAEYYKIPKEDRKKGLKVNLSTAIFVPKPFTPFQWESQIKMEDVMDKIKVLRSSIQSKQIAYSWHETPVSYLEAVFARGDRRLCEVLIKAFEKGAKFDGWSEHFKLKAWKEALEESGVDGDFYAYRKREYQEILPWDFIEIGVDKSYLISESEKAKNAAVTQDCRLGCTNCGVNVNLEGKCFEGAVSN